MTKRTVAQVETAIARHKTEWMRRIVARDITYRPPSFETQAAYERVLAELEAELEALQGLRPETV